MSKSRRKIEVTANRAELREEYDEVIIPTSPTGSGLMHIPGRCGTYCWSFDPASGRSPSLTTKPVSVFPEGYKDWCSLCLYVREAERMPQRNLSIEVEYDAED